MCSGTKGQVGLQIPVMLVVGENEETNNSVSIRRRHKGALGSQSIDELLVNLLEEIKTKRRN